MEKKLQCFLHPAPLLMQANEVAREGVTLFNERVSMLDEADYQLYKKILIQIVENSMKLRDIIEEKREAGKQYESHLEYQLEQKLREQYQLGL